MVLYVIFGFGFVLRYSSLPNSLPLLIPPSPFLCPLTGQLVAWHPPDALLRTVGMLCFGSVSMPAWQHVGSANPDSVEVWEQLAFRPHGSVVNPQVVMGSKTVVRWVGITHDS